VEALWAAARSASVVDDRELLRNLDRQGVRRTMGFRRTLQRLGLVERRPGGPEALRDDEASA